MISLLLELLIGLFRIAYYLVMIPCKIIMGILRFMFWMLFGIVRGLFLPAKRRRF